MKGKGNLMGREKASDSEVYELSFGRGDEETRKGMEGMEGARVGGMGGMGTGGGGWGGVTGYVYKLTA